MKKLLVALVVALSLSTAYASDAYNPSYQYNLQPVAVYTGKTVIVKKHYDVYQPRIVYDKVGSYTKVKVCQTCAK